MHHKKLISIIILLLVFATLAVFWQVQNHEFIDYDDDDYVTENLYVKSGLTAEGVIWAFTTAYASNWHPLTWMSHMLDYEIYRLNPGGHHLTNLLLHIANTLLLFLLLKGMTGTIWRSAFVAALFALHPLHVESVAWVSERKDVLSTFFWMLTMWTYVRYVKRPGIKRYLIVLLFLTLGLMSKPMLVTLPFVLILVDYWPLGRIKTTAHSLWHDILRVFREKVPFFILTAASSTITFFVQQSGGSVESMELLTLKERIANALFSYASYIGKMIWPQHLAVFYPHPLDSLSAWQYTGTGLLILCISLLVFWKVQRYPYLLVGWLWYLGTLVPVIGIVQVGSQAMADRYTYVPLIGLFIIIAWGVPDILSRWHYRRIMLSITGGIVILVLMLSTWFQVQYWRNSITLFKHAGDVIVDNYLAHYNLGTILYKQNKPEKAISHYSEVIRSKPGHWKAYNNLGTILYNQGKLEESISYFSRALRIKPDEMEPLNNIGVALAEQGKLNEAIDFFSEALRIMPEDSEVHQNLGFVLAEQGKLEEAVSHYARALQIKPDYAEAHYEWGVVLAKQRKHEDAITHFSEALQIKPDFKEAQYNLKLALKEVGKNNKTINTFTDP